MTKLPLKSQVPHALTDNSFDHVFNLTYFLWQLRILSWETYEPFVDLSNVAQIDGYIDRVRGIKYR